MTQDYRAVSNHYFQSKAWAQARNETPWKSRPISVNGVEVYAYSRRSPLGPVVHIPGFHPLPEQVPELTSAVKQAFPRALVCKLETVAPRNDKLEEALKQKQWLPARVTQYAYTVQLDLSKSVEALRTDMKKRARNEINRALNNQVRVKRLALDDEHLHTMYELLARTASRKRFNIHDQAFTFACWRNLREAGMLRLFVAEHEGQILASAVIVINQDGKKAWYKEGASTQLQPAINAPRLLLWDIAQSLKQTGVTEFDLGGIPDPATYEQSSMKGVFIFKTAYTDTVTEMMPAYELPLKTYRYKLWPKCEVVLRKIAQLRHANWY